MSILLEIRHIYQFCLRDFWIMHLKWRRGVEKKSCCWFNNIRFEILRLWENVCFQTCSKLVFIRNTKFFSRWLLRLTCGLFDCSDFYNHISLLPIFLSSDYNASQVMLTAGISRAQMSSVPPNAKRGRYMHSRHELFLLSLPECVLQSWIL